MTARESTVVLCDFGSGAARLSALATDWSNGQFKPSDLPEADALLRGLQHLMVEIRQLAMLEA